MSNFVFVVEPNKHPQNPVHPASARLLLNQGKAAIYRRFPLTIILKESYPHTQTKPLEVKIDPGSGISDSKFQICNPKSKIPNPKSNV